MKDEAKEKFCQEASEWHICLNINAKAIAHYSSSAAILAQLNLSIVIPPQIERSERELCEQVRRAGIAAIWKRLHAEGCSVECESVEALYDADCIEGVLKNLIRASERIYPENQRGRSWVSPNTALAGVADPHAELKYNQFSIALRYTNCQSLYKRLDWVRYLGPVADCVLKCCWKSMPPVLRSRTVVSLAQYERDLDKKTLTNRIPKTIKGSPMKKNGLIILAFITIVGGYFVFFFETEAQKSERLAKAEQDRIEALGAWQVSQRSTSSNRELARKMGVSQETFSEAFGDISSSVRDLHYEASLFLATAYQNEDGSYSMTVSFGEVDKLTSAKLDPPRDSALSSYSSSFLMKSYDDEASQSEKERAERTFHLISRLSSPFSTDCYGKVCRFDLSPAHLKLLSRHAEFVVEVRGWTLGSRSGNRIPISQKYQVPTQGLFENLQLDFEVGSENVDSVATAKKYVCQEAKDLCSDL